jgi:hypothetical protein
MRCILQLRRFTAASLHNHGRPRGAARDARQGILDHDFVDPQASWTVPEWVIANGGGAEFMITFFQPSAFTNAFFDEQIKLVDT